MSKFTLHWHPRARRHPETFEAATLADTCRQANIPAANLIMLTGFDQDGRYVEVAGSARCNCLYHADDGTSCRHDLVRFGLDHDPFTNQQMSLAPDAPRSQWLVDKRAEYLDRIARGYHSHDPAMLALEHCKVFILNLLIEHQGQPLTLIEVMDALLASSDESRRCVYYDPTYGSSIQESWTIIDAYLTTGGAGLHNGTGHQSTV